MDYKGLKICKILEPTFMEDNKVFKVNDVCLGYEANNNIVIVSGDYAGNIYPNIKKFLSYLIILIAEICIYYSAVHTAFESFKFICVCLSKIPET